jgi:uncharacterized protein YegJ (DUF2314 family)
MQMNPFPAIVKGTRRKIRLIAVVGTLVIAGLTLNSQATNITSQALKQGNGGPEYFQVPNNHAAMHQAVREARKTVGKFIAALKNPGPGQQDFEVKKPFVQGSEVEHIWLSDVRFVGKHFEGRVDNQPQKIQGVKLGQVVSVNPKEISDWLYVDSGKLVGGYTVRAHYDELSPQQKREFDRNADFTIGKQ